MTDAEIAAGNRRFTLSFSMNDADHALLLQFVEKILPSDPSPGRPEGAALSVLVAVIESYEKVKWPFPMISKAQEAKNDG